MRPMYKQIKALHKNWTRELTLLPQGRKAIENRWVYMTKRDRNDQFQ